MDLNEKIIECVRKHSCLYEPSNKDYKNAVLKARLWQSIAGQTNESADTIKKKWKSMRDGYMKYKKQVKGTTGCERKTIKFMWSAQLSFLDSTINPRETASNVCEGNQTQISANTDTLPSFSSTPSDCSVPRASSPTPGTSSDAVSDLPRISTPSVQPLEPISTRRQPNKRIAEPDVDSMIVDFINKKKEKHNYDSVDYLFLSYAHTFKKLSNRKQAMLKVDLAKLFSEAELSEMTDYVHHSSAYSVASSTSDNFDNTTMNIYTDNTRNVYSENNIDVYSNGAANVINVDSDNATNFHSYNVITVHSDNANVHPNNIMNVHSEQATNAQSNNVVNVNSDYTTNVNDSL